MEETLLTPFKGIAFLLAFVLLLYPGVLLVQVLTGTVTESVSQIAVLLGLSPRVGVGSSPVSEYRVCWRENERV